MTLPDEPTRTARDDRALDRRSWLAIFAAFALLYCLTAQHGPAWQDSGMHQLRALRGQFANPLGLALAHPLLIAVGQPLKWIFGGARMATALNMASSVAMALAVANVYLIVLRLGARRKAALAAAVMLGAAHTPWWLATITESYCGVCAGLTSELLILHSLIKRPAGWKLCLLAAVNGLGWSLHNFFLLPLPVYLLTAGILTARRRVAIGWLAAAAGCWLIGGGLFVGLIVSEMARSGEIVATIRSALFGSMWQTKVLGVTQRSLMRAALYFFINFPWLSWLIVLYGIKRLVAEALTARTAPGGDADEKTVAARFALAVVGVAAIELLFAVRYEVPDQFMFLLPSFVLMAVAAGLAIDAMLDWKRPRLVLALIWGSILLTPVLYGATPAALNAAGKSIRPGREIPYRNENRYWISPWKQNERSAVQLSVTLLNMAGPDSVLVPGDTLAPPMVYIQQSWPLRGDVVVAWLDEERFAPGGDRLKQWETGTTPAQWLQAAGGRDIFVLKTQPSPAPQAVVDCAVSLEDDLLYRITPQSLQARIAPE